MVVVLLNVLIATVSHEHCPAATPPLQQNTALPTNKQKS